MRTFYLYPDTNELVRSLIIFYLSGEI